MSAEPIPGDDSTGGFSAVVVRLARDLIKTLRVGASWQDPHKVRRAGEDLATLAAVLCRSGMGADDANHPPEPPPGSRMVRVGKDYFAAPGHELVRRSANQITGIMVDGLVVPMEEVEFVDGRVRRRKRARGATRSLTMFAIDCKKPLNQENRE